MKPATARWILTRIFKFTIVDPDLPPEPKHIILGVPHTSIWDFVVAWLYDRSIGGHPRVMIKKEFFFWPLGALLRKLGAIPVDRKNAVGITRQVIDEMARCDSFHLCIAPEGTRKPVKRWKTGFHTFAKAADIPVYLGYFDWGRKEIGHGPRFECSDDSMADLRAVQAFYKQKGVQGKHPGCLEYL
ncbi:MAG: 1-acyl-sn-glycerol-3-phosphate acyltransferase [Bacteroidales bacterium]|nr:1-acyl-sn-glycerol-3-phosphate acyltransferase [Bacteroidales bacterium]